MLRIYYTVLLICIGVGGTFSQTVIKVQYDTKQLSEFTSYINSGNVIVVDSSYVILNLANTILMKVERKSGEVDKFLDNKTSYQFIRSKIAKYSQFDTIVFFESKEYKDIPTCSQHYIDYRHIVQVKENLYMTEIGIPLKKGLTGRDFIDGILYFDANLNILDYKIIEFRNNQRSAVGWSGILFDKDNYYFHAFNDGSEWFYRRFVYKDDFVFDVGEFSDIPKPTHRNLNMTREYSNIKNDSQYCMSNGEKIYCMEECYSGKKVKEYDLEVGERESYSNIIQIDDKDLYVAHKVLLSEYGGALFSWIELLDENFQKVKTILEWDIRVAPINSLSYYDGKIIMCLENRSDKDVYIYEKEILMD